MGNPNDQFSLNNLLERYTTDMKSLILVVVFSLATASGFSTVARFGKSCPLWTRRPNFKCGNICGETEKFSVVTGDCPEIGGSSFVPFPSKCPCADVEEVEGNGSENSNEKVIQDTRVPIA